VTINKPNLPTAVFPFSVHKHFSLFTECHATETSFKTRKGDQTDRVFNDLGSEIAGTFTATIHFSYYLLRKFKNHVTAFPWRIWVRLICLLFTKLLYIQYNTRTIFIYFMHYYRFILMLSTHICNLFKSHFFSLIYMQRHHCPMATERHMVEEQR
jgi:hypothetical protein